MNDMSLLDEWEISCSGGNFISTQHRLEECLMNLILTWLPLLSSFLTNAHVVNHFVILYFDM